MAQQGNAVNLLVQDGSGNHQLIKVKTIVKDVNGQYAGSSQTIRGMAGQNQTHKIVTMSSGPNKTIKLTPTQMNAIKLASESSSHHSAKMISSYSSTIPSASSSHTATVTSQKKTATPPSGGIQSRRRKTDKVGKGLRHFSMKVCEKVKEKGVTTYNEVADELVQEEIEGQPIDPLSYDQKNIRRRVYDALNVLMAMNIISKEKKEIRWIGLPSSSIQQCTTLEQENQKRRERIEEKKQQLKELLLQHVSFKSLVTRNKEAEDKGIVPTASSAIQLPFIIVNTYKKTQINCSISNDKSEYFFKFDDKFEIHDDIEILKRMGLLLGLDKGECAQEDIDRAKTMVPHIFRKYIEMYGRGQDETMSEDWEMNSYNEYFGNESPLITPKAEYCDDDDDEMIGTDSEGD